MSLETVVNSPALVVGSVVVGGALLYALSQRSSKCPDGLKPLSALPGPPRHFLLGNLRDLMKRNVHRRLTEWADEFGPLYTLNLMGSTVLVLSDIQLARPLLKGAGELRKHGPAYGGASQATNASKQPTMFSIANPADLPFHEALRKALSPSFAPSNLLKNFPKLREHATRVADRLGSLGGSQEFDVAPYLMTGNMDMVADIGYGMSFHALDDPVNNKFFKGLKGALDELSKRVTNPLREPFQSLFWFLPSSQKVLRDHEDSYKIYQQLMAELKSRGEPNPDDQSIWACIMRFRDPATGKQLEGDKLQAVVSTMLVGGIETSATAILWALYDIARQPDVQRGLDKELTAAGLITPEGKPGRPIEWSDLTGLSYFNSVMKESMRLNTVAGSTATFRVTDKAMQIGPVWVPKNTPVWMPTHALANACHNFPVPSEFHPERWAESRNTVGLVADTPAPAATTTKAVAEGSLTTPHDWMSLVFSQGSRGCVGLNQGLMQTRATLLVLLSRLRFKIGPTAADHQAMMEGQEMALTMVSSLGFPFIVTPR